MCGLIHTPSSGTDKKMYIQQNFFNQMSSTLDIFIICNFRRVVPRPEVLLFTRERFYQGNRQISEDMFKKAHRSPDDFDPADVDPSAILL
jgi:hypothetical protein